MHYIIYSVYIPCLCFHKFKYMTLRAPNFLNSAVYKVYISFHTAACAKFNHVDYLVHIYLYSFLSILYYIVPFVGDMSLKTSKLTWSPIDASVQNLEVIVGPFLRIEIWSLFFDRTNQKKLSESGKILLRVI